jgi:hypothetical protein
MSDDEVRVVGGRRFGALRTGVNGCFYASQCASQYALPIQFLVRHLGLSLQMGDTQMECRIVTALTCLIILTCPRAASQEP